jgi:Protein of unknown function (DUF2510)
MQSGSPPAKGARWYRVKRAKGRQASPPDGFYRDPGGRDGVRYWGGGEWSPLFPADLPVKQAGEFPGTVVAPLPASDGTWEYAASAARKARNESAAFGAGVLVVLVLIVERMLSDTIHLSGLGVVLALRAFFAWRAWRRWTMLDRVARAMPSFDSLAV